MSFPSFKILVDKNSVYDVALSRCGHLDFTPFKLILTKLRLDEIIVWCHVSAMNVSIHYCYGNREHDRYGDSVIIDLYHGVAILTLYSIVTKLRLVPCLCNEC